jgi:hypothetical protein
MIKLKKTYEIFMVKPAIMDIKKASAKLSHSSENDTHGIAIMNDIVYIDHMKIADVPASPS